MSNTEITSKVTDFGLFISKTPDSYRYKHPDSTNKLFSDALEWYEKTSKCYLTCKFIVPDWEPRLYIKIYQSSNDGIVYIKTPLDMYSELLDYMSTSTISKSHEHIHENHYAHMQGMMFVAKKQWCDYVIYSTRSNKVYTERIYFDIDFWNNTLYPAIVNYFNYN